MLKLNSQDIPHFTFRRVLPKWLGPGDVECFIEVEARAGGAVNPGYIKDLENLVLQGKVMDRKAEKIDDDEAFVMQSHKDVTTILRSQFALLYDNCVLSWTSNILNDGAPIEPNRENFLALTEAKIAGINDFIRAFEAEVMSAGASIQEETEATIKN